MTPADVGRQRLFSQRIAAQPLATPAEVVGWLGAVQAQDFLGGLWALGLRMPTATEAAVEQAFADGAILRTHILRPTWHFVTPADIRWMQALTGPRIQAGDASRRRELGLDAATLVRTNTLIEKALAGGQYLTRQELGERLAREGIEADSARMNHIMIEAETAAVVCSGPRRGKQFTYALLEERVPPAKALTRDESVAELVLRFFTSHGPATIKDFVWWSGLTVTDARAGIEAAQGQLVSETVNGQVYWMSSTPLVMPDTSSEAYLLPSYDEFLVSYNDRTPSLASEHQAAWNVGNAVFACTVVREGQVVGFWKRTLKKSSVAVEVSPLKPWTDTDTETCHTTVHRYGDFLGLKAQITQAEAGMTTVGDTSGD